MDPQHTSGEEPLLQLGEILSHRGATTSTPTPLRQVFGHLSVSKIYLFSPLNETVFSLLLHEVLLQSQGSMPSCSFIALSLMLLFVQGLSLTEGLGKNVFHLEELLFFGVLQDHHPLKTWLRQTNCKLNSKAETTTEQAPQSQESLFFFHTYCISFKCQKMFF